MSKAERCPPAELHWYYCDPCKWGAWQATETECPNGHPTWCGMSETEFTAKS